MTPGLARSCEHKSKLFKIAKVSKTAEAKSIFTAYRNKLKSILLKAEKEFYATKILQCNNDCKKSWKVINSILNKKKQALVPSENFLVNGQSIVDKQVIADSFNDYFVGIGCNLAGKISKPKHSFLKYMPNNAPANPTCALFLTSTAEIINIVNNMKNSEAQVTMRCP